MDHLDATIERIIYHKTSQYSDTGCKFLIAQVTPLASGDGEVPEQATIKGEMNSVCYGWRYKFFGDWRDDPQRGRFFSFASFEPIIQKSKDGLVDYLANHVPQIGVIRAHAIVDHFGDETLSILREEPMRVEEVPGISEKTASLVAEFFASDNIVDPEAYSRLYELLSSIRPPRDLIKKLIEQFGSNAPQFIQDHPYKLLDYAGMGWDRVDRLAVHVLKFDPNGVERHRCAVLEILDRNAGRGHTKADYSVVKSEVSSLLGTVPREDVFGVLIEDHRIYIDSDLYVSDHSLYRAEMAIAGEITRIQHGAGPLGFTPSSEDLDQEQHAIPIMVHDHSVSILSGVPGSGKSFTTSVIVRCLRENGIHQILVVAPTGKAAKRASEFMRQRGIDVPCMTIHRSLNARTGSVDEEGISQEDAKANRGREGWSFERGRDNQLPYDFFVVDESSMVDVRLAARFFQSIPSGSRLLIVGDHHQLPSVGPGSVLRDLIDSGVPTAILDKPRRNSGAIAHACWRIKEGLKTHPRLISNEESGGINNWTHLEVKSDHEILSRIMETHRNYIARYGYDMAKTNLQVISPEKKGTLGCKNLNAVLSPIVNPLAAGESFVLSGDDKDDEGSMRAGDRVVRTKNGNVKCLVDCGPDNRPPGPPDYDPLVVTLKDEPTYASLGGRWYAVAGCYVVNGDMGEIVAPKGSGPFKSTMVRFSHPDRLCMLPSGDAHILLAYAMTVHKMQGSSMPICIIPLSSFYWNEKLNTGLFSRELVYTAFSRPSERLITVGRIAELSAAIDRKTINRRMTRLREIMS